MQKNIFFIFLFYMLSISCCFGSICKTAVKVIYTAAVIDDFYDRRKEEYLYSLQVLQAMGITPYVVEACRTYSFFDACKVPVFYSNVNDISLRNKGVNEARSLLEALNHYAFDDEDLIVKLTGRYFFMNEQFFTEINANLGMDAYAKLTGLHPYPISEIDYFTGCFALKCKYLKMFLNELDFDQMEKESLHIEWELGKFFQRHAEIRVHNIKTLHVMARVFGRNYDGPNSVQ